MPVRVPSGVVDPAVQFVWADGRVMAWNPEVPFRGLSAVVHHADQRVVALHLPGEPEHGRVPVVCRAVPLAALDALADLGTVDEGMQPSVAWCAALHDYARRIVRSARVVPHLEPHAELPPQRDGARWWRVTWVPLAVDLHAARALLGSAPRAVLSAAGPHAEPRWILAAMVDRIARASLGAAGWYTTLPEIRSSTARAVRLVGRSLAAESALFSVPPELSDAVDTLAAEFSDLQRRANGEPVVRLRLRLSTPTGSVDHDTVSASDDPVAAENSAADDSADYDGASGWPLNAEVVDVDDRSRWCDVRALAEHLPAGIDVARGAHHAPAVLAQVESVLHTLAGDQPELAMWVGAVLGGSTSLCVDIDAASAVLDGVDSLAERGIEIIVPERLVRGAAVARGMARPAEQGAGAAGRSGMARFGARSLVEWQVVVDDTPVSEEALRRAAAGGASLIESGGRWVQIDRADAERALIRLAEHRLQHSDLSPLELIELAAELAAARADADRLSGRSSTRRRSTSLATPSDALDDNLATGAELHGAGWAAELLAGLPDASSRDGVVPGGFTATLRPYQRRGLGWLQGLRELGLGGCLADDMGLGKTPTTLAHLAGLAGPHLVVCPLSVVHNWETEAARFTPGLRVLVHHGAARADAEAFSDAVGSHDIVVTTYQVATRDIDLLRSVEWSTLVLDEAQMVKNPDTATARALRTVRAGQAVALTGTPVENRLRELWSIFNIVVPGLLGSAARFRDRFATPIERQRDAAATAALRQLTGPFLLRRTKADRSLVPDLPDKVEQVAWAALTREQAVMYQAVVDRLMREAAEATGMERRGLVLSALTRLKQVCNHPAHALADGSRLSGRSGKLHRFDELLADFLDTGERALVFTQFAEMGMLLQQHLLERHHLTVPFLHGGLSKRARDRMVADFSASGSPIPLMVVSLRAGGTGLNLVAASRVVHYDRWWNPAVEDQATDRAWRIGQERSVFVHKLVCEGTVEERIDALVNDKRALADAVIGSSGERWLSELSNDELHDLVSLDHTRVRP